MKAGPAFTIDTVLYEMKCPRTNVTLFQMQSLMGSQFDYRKGFLWLRLQWSDGLWLTSKAVVRLLEHNSVLNTLARVDDCEFPFCQ